jgi:zinc ribbon protein
LASKVLTDFPRVNLVSVVAGAVALISVFLPWWGIDGSGSGVTASVNWSLWGQPWFGDTSSSPALAVAMRTMGLFNMMILALVFITAALAFFGSFDRDKAYLAAGFTSSITTLLVYAGAVSYTISIACQGAASCISGPVGSTVFPTGDVANWGFRVGFYLFLVGGIMILFGVIFHQVFLRRKEGIIQPVASQGGKFCSNCGHVLQSDAKFCSNCAHATPN